MVHCARCCGICDMAARRGARLSLQPEALAYVPELLRSAFNGSMLPLPELQLLRRAFTRVVGPQMRPRDPAHAASSGHQQGPPGGKPLRGRGSHCWRDGSRTPACGPCCSAASRLMSSRSGVQDGGHPGPPPAARASHDSPPSPSGVAAALGPAAPGRAAAQLLHVDHATTRRKVVAAAISGGVDSAVAAKRMVDDGHEVLSGPAARGQTACPCGHSRIQHVRQQPAAAGPVQAHSAQRELGWLGGGAGVRGVHAQLGRNGGAGQPELLRGEGLPGAAPPPALPRDWGPAELGQVHVGEAAP